MRIRPWSFVLLISMVLCLFFVEQSCAEPKVAVVEIVRLVRGHPSTDKNRLVLDKMLDEFEAEKAALIEQAEAKGKAFEAAREAMQNPALSQDALSEKREEAQAKLRELREFERDIREKLEGRKNEMADQEARMRESVITDVKDAVDSYAKKKGHKLVLAKTEEGIGAVLFSADEFDITDEVLKLMNGEE